RRDAYHCLQFALDSADLGSLTSGSVCQVIFVSRGTRARRARGEHGHPRLLALGHNPVVPALRDHHRFGAVSCHAGRAACAPNQRLTLLYFSTGILPASAKNSGATTVKSASVRVSPTR